MKRVIALHNKRGRGPDDAPAAAVAVAAEDASADAPPGAENIATLPTATLHDAVAAHAYGEPPSEAQEAESEVQTIEQLMRQKRARLTAPQSSVVAVAMDSSSRGATDGATDELDSLLDWRGRGFRRQ